MELVLLLVLSILPVFYKINLGVYLFETKKIHSNFGKRKLFNFWFPIELLFFIFSLSLFYNPRLEIVFFPMMFYFFIFYNIFVLGKLFRGRIEKIIKHKKYVYLGLFIYMSDIAAIFYFLENRFVYSYILFIFLLIHLIYMFLFFNSKGLEVSKIGR